MTKTELVEYINNNVSDINGKIIVERLDDGRLNFRTLMCTKEHFINLLNNNFNDTLHGDYGDGVKTTILEIR